MHIQRIRNGPSRVAWILAQSRSPLPYSLIHDSLRPIRPTLTGRSVRVYVADAVDRGWVRRVATHQGRAYFGCTGLGRKHAETVDVGWTY